ncbi:MAG: hypothetical protein COW01_02310 [Bdellovibrionales bacterium CG12_big_fil_rev_8_21_14_0_65_38_15]|nr:MAG: hypothetical protein COW79_02545 [Bdellovibrionales bacterium CG22_combo_CG10-13_8_21_14_all_38_13]PIQ57140.1 MAG: hypothetical protein COW01_02310 [Bdellovibrionales bacterium CG12_big_fil_rev_8_21_14_0_65_38_15]PIR30170.1 MAG: hypothetical protein COV38_07705 [Bdellovibrionales bacterium CG11_big_fil_rev_8_21_14_0_20_38_13]
MQITIEQKVFVIIFIIIIIQNIKKRIEVSIAAQVENNKVDALIGNIKKGSKFNFWEFMKLISIERIKMLKKLDELDVQAADKIRIRIYNLLILDALVVISTPLILMVF